MNAPWSFICLVLAFVFFALGAFAWPVPFETYRLKIIAVGLMFWVLSVLVKAG